ncbi:MAG: metal ABC transporter permease [Hyphomicrobiaceae bacterium]
MDPFLVRALAAGLMLAVVAAPLGCLVVWNRMAYFGETVAHASLIGIALAVMLRVDLTLGAIASAALVALVVLLLTRQKLVGRDAVLGVAAHGSLALGLSLIALTRGPSVDLMGFLVGDILAVAPGDLVAVAAGGVLILVVTALVWRPLLAVAVHDELAAAEGAPADRVEAVFVVLLAVAIAAAIKIVGILLAMAFLVMPAVAARPFAATPERMVALAAAIAAAGVLAGLALSLTLDLPGGPAIVLVLSCAAGASLVLGRTA